MAGPTRVQIQISLPYRHEPRDHPRVRQYLDDGYRVVQLFRATDQEAVVTLALPPAPAPGAGDAPR